MLVVHFLTSDNVRKSMSTGRVPGLDGTRVRRNRLRLLFLAATLFYSVHAPVLWFCAPQDLFVRVTRDHVSPFLQMLGRFSSLRQAGNALSFLLKGNLGAKTKLFFNIQITYGMACLIYELIVERESALSVPTVLLILQWTPNSCLPKHLCMYTKQIHSSIFAYALLNASFRDFTR